MMQTKDFQPDWFSPPGDTIKDLIKEKGISPLSFSKYLDFDADTTKKLLDGEIQITNDIANKLTTLFGASNEFWLNRESDYQEDLKRYKRNLLEKREWLNQLPLKDMVKYGWIAYHPRKLEEKFRVCLNFFGVNSLDQWYESYRDHLNVAEFRTSKTFDSKVESIVTWLRQGEIESSTMDCASWEPNKFKEALNISRSFTRIKDPSVFLPKLQKLFSSCGVAIVILPTPSRCRASGATFFIDKNKAIIILSFRYLSDDHFWFTLYHEAGHLLLHGKDRLFMEGENFVSEEDKEKEANEFSFNHLIPLKYQQEMQELSAKNWKKIPRFAKKIGISSGIVVGQLQHLGIVRHDYLNKLKTRYKWKEELNP